MTPPAQYADCFATDGPREGALRVDPGWFQLWPPQDLAARNRDYNVDEFAPGFLGFGSSGGGEMLAFDSDERVVMIPFVGMSSDQARLVADSWLDFLGKISDET